MINKQKIRHIALSLAALMSFSMQAQSYADTKKGKALIAEMTGKFGYSQADLQQLFSQVSRDENILKKISRPAEKTTPWYKYRRIFMDDKRLNNGIIFYRKHEKVLNEAYQKYGVPPAIIVAIIGVETRYGKVMGNDKVITALATIGFDYPKRETFFSKELRAFLQMAAEENFDPLTPVGSYAGAMGMAQFMPSSYLNFAVDYEGDGQRDLWKNPNDAIFSIANYLQKNGWQRDGLIVDKASLLTEYQGKRGHKPFTVLGQLKSAGVLLTNAVAHDDTKVGYLVLDGEHGDLPFVTFNNFATITTYNTSPLYAMAVTGLSRAIEAGLSHKP